MTSMAASLGIATIPPSRNFPSRAHGRQPRRPWSELQAQSNQFLPRAFGIIGVGEQLRIGSVHHPVLHQTFEVDDTRPVSATQQDNRKAAHFGRLYER